MTEVAGEGTAVHDHAGRREQLRALLSAEGLGLLLVTTPANVAYLSGFTGTNGQVLIGRDPGGDRLITDGRYEARAADEARGLPVVLSRDPVEVALRVAAGGGGGGGADGGSRAGGVPDAAVLGAEAEHLTWASARGLRDRARACGVRIEPTTGLVERLRVVKDEAEIARLRRACHLTVAALDWLTEEVVAVGRSERELAVALERRFVDSGADGVAFPSIVASGPNAAVPHHAPGERRLQDGDLLTVDCGAEVGGYHADCTRTYAIGEVGDRLRGVYALVLAAQAAGRAAAVAGATGGDVDEAAREVIAAGGYGEAFVHGTGHGVGLDIHEAPAVAKGSRATLRPGTALTVEPGVYLPGIGGVRIEDTIVVTADGSPTVLTPAPRDLRVLPGGPRG